MLNDREIEEFFQGATWGAEFDVMNADRRAELPPGNSWNPHEPDGWTDAGICIDNTGTINMFGAEINTRVCDSSDELYDCMMEIAHAVIPHDPIRLPDPPHAIHVHVRIPALLESPDLLRHLLVYGEKWDEQLQAHIFRGFEPSEDLICSYPERASMDNWARVTRVARTRGYQPDAINRALLCKSNDVKEIVKALHINWRDMKCDFRPDGVPLWSIEEGAPMVRPCYNYGHLLTTETVEFRAFIATVDPKRLRNIVEYPQKYLTAALRSDPNPLHLVQNVDFQDTTAFGTVNDPVRMRARRAATDIYLHTEEEIVHAIRYMLMTEELTLADLNYPDYWKSEGF